MDGILTSHRIDPTHLRANDFQAFYQRRQNALLVLVEQAMGKVIERVVDETADDPGEYPPPRFRRRPEPIPID
jgi:hypothetical protein